VPAAIGGPMLPASDDRVVLRWLANINYEVDYHGQTFLLDAAYNRKPRNRPLGFTAEQVKKADLILIGHAHFDHMSDAPMVARQTGAKVVGDPIAVETAVKMGLPRSQTMVVKGGESFKVGDVTVDVALAHHSEPGAGLTAALGNLFVLENGPLTPEEQATTTAVMARGSFDPAIAATGTMVYALTFPNGFKIVHVSSGGPITDGDRALAQKLGPVDIAIVAYQAHATFAPLVAATFPLVQLFKPRLFLPGHHDASYGTWLYLGLEPLFEKIRDDLPDTRFLAPLYRSPICVATSGSRRGDVTFKY
jgi:L-ascorbate metabolism protein UlaG (beta-lactamase superfamily)